MDVFARFTLWLAAVGFLAFGAWLLLAPLHALGLMGVEASGAVAAVEFRAFYGGVQLGTAALFIVAAVHAPWRRFGLWLCLAVFGGIAAARVSGMAAEGVATGALLAALAVELGLAVMAGVALRGLRGSG